ncbi:hypothetical protein DL766_004931 [Monosporascus sp. MC13-8B]|uniref:BTB domain-containing protein n=1 Tax=Monosporascus cannonballus TaxID=155416 RepID=A0ABY0HHQ6_9PEZI|nr:hypothetical protein DL763_010213 [Monosporascus cannonballus]RYO92801.1 hypothetical protein DL762_001507 [Monosporascus cannonballus]RYP30330.1 hypothetical protein DL766_004931 [Monosporascus sp. MC13-8B]
MATPFQSILESKLVQFTIGPEKKEFLVHNYAWTYSGSYTDPQPVIFADSSLIDASTTEDGNVGKSATATAGAGKSATIALEEDAESLVSFIRRPYCQQCHPTFPSNRRPKCEKCLNPSKKRQMVTEFISSSSYPCPSHSPPPRQNTKYDENYAPVFLSHARLYVMADKYDVPKLGKLALHKLWETLKIFTPYPSRLGDIVSLIAYAFNSFSESAEGDKMCTMLVHYSGCIYENLTAYDGFKTLVEDCPLFTHGLMKKIDERLS